ncbi:replication restart DNA helicase PriA [Natranaerovirga pectinivora]|uniref:Replication restart protein PriA n=1 Tax=Natranaerovirga pectinivora TaxID=682400 RepID=A0A4R3MNZ2_9FIRM|nr:primosomal protein N' [Natranaerovirga pectinivora]TCT16941.1 replication restart DNA helicase PriA [Natranaerovirga pectinivora]
MAKRYADIIIDILHQDLDKTFQYIIPEMLQDKIAIGTSVEVPFGKGNKLIKGFVINISNKPQIDPSKLKEIHKSSNEKVNIESQLIQLALWMSNQYSSTIISALKTVLPIHQKIKHKEEKRIHLVIDDTKCKELIESAKKKNHVAILRLMETLKEKSNLDYTYVTKNLKIPLATLKKLELNQIIEIISKENYRKPHNFNKNQSYTQPTIFQQKIIDEVVSDYYSEKFKTYLLHGVTGSGKTEVYMRIIEEVLNSGRQAIVLIPEISLTHQTVKRFYERFGEKVGVIHSKLSQGERYDQYVQAKNGAIQIMVGPRSALFAPFENLGIIIIDEEHETTYKSDTTPKYHSKEVAIKRAEISNASVVLGSATPSMESYTEALEGNYKLLELKERIDNRPLPTVSIVDMREELIQGNKSMLSESLRSSILDRLNKKEQIILFINRRGYSRFVSCRECGFVIKCDHCDVAFTYHNNGKLICHYCGKNISMPSTCPSCKSKYIKQFGTGTQKVEEYIQKEFPRARILRMDTDTTSKKDSYEQILTKFGDGRADILIGTQMVAKGHDFPNVTLVGVLAADLSLYMNDYRSSERTFSLLTQVAGRAGRGAIKGDVIIQTYSPEHFSIQNARMQDYNNFYNEEISYRRIMNYPPFTNIMVILLISEDENLVIKTSYELVNLIKNMLDSTNCDIIGPTPASISKMNNLFRQVIYIKAEEYNRLLEIKKKIEIINVENNKYNNMAMQFDFNPLFSY